MRVPFEIIVEEADRLILKMASAKNMEDRVYYWDAYLSYLELCGWSNQQLDRELLNRIDAAWDFNKFNIN